MAEESNRLTKEFMQKEYIRMNRIHLKSRIDVVNINKKLKMLKENNLEKTKEIKVMESELLGVEKELTGVQDKYEDLFKKYEKIKIEHEKLLIKEKSLAQKNQNLTNELKKLSKTPILKLPSNAKRSPAEL